MTDNLGEKLDALRLEMLALTVASTPPLREFIRDLEAQRERYKAALEEIRMMGAAAEYDCDCAGSFLDVAAKALQLPSP